jgi:hypothetical protein
MQTVGLRLLGWAVHLAFFAAWIQVALIMEGQMHDEPQARAASSSAPPAAALAAGEGPHKTSARNARDLKPRAG